MIQTAFRSFMAALIDYAGIFPPASLPLDQAINNYTQYIQHKDSWMLSRFIIPTKRLPELTTLLNPSFTYPLSLLGRGGQTGAEWLANLQADTVQATQFRQGSNVTTDVIEVRLPQTVLAGEEQMVLADLLAHAQVTLAGVRPFYEVVFDDDWETWFPVAVTEVAAHNQRNKDNAGIKLRFGGIEPHMFPTVAQVARALILCRDQRVPLKATAGLHHPFRHDSEDVQTKMHGFINVFSAGIFAQIHTQLTQTDLEAILGDEDPTHFIFTPEKLQWFNYAANQEDIQNYRQQSLISFGSCSFEEPREDLQKIGLL